MIGFAGGGRRPQVPGMDVVVPMCGIGSCLGGYIGSIVSRACGSFRVVLISSNSASSDPTVYSSCTGRSGEMGMVRGRGNKRNSTHGINVSVTRKRCVVFISDSSCVSRGVLRRAIAETRGCSTSVMLRSCCAIGRGNRVLFECSSILPHRGLVYPSRSGCVLGFSLATTDAGLCGGDVFGSSRLHFTPEI